MGILWDGAIPAFHLRAESGSVRVLTSELVVPDPLGRRYATDVFGGPLEDVEGGRWSTEEAATAGHAAVVARVLGAVTS